MKLRFITLGIVIGLFISIIAEAARPKKIVEVCHISLTQDWEKTASPREKAYYEHLLNTKP